MGLTINLLPKTRKIFKSAFIFFGINGAALFFINRFTDAICRIKNFYFPPKFPWDWKLEMLFYGYERETVGLFKKIIRPGMVVIDIGAHVGYYTKLFSSLVGKNGHVFAFEAEENNFKLLQRNLKKNNNVALINKAIADTVGAIDFYKVKSSTGSHSIVPTGNSEKINVSATTLDEFLGENGNPKINVIKIDIEGGELRAFEGMRQLFARSSRLFIITEFLPAALAAAGLTPLQFFARIEGFGFKIFQILEGGATSLLSAEEIRNLRLYRTGYANLLLKKNAEENIGNSNLL